MFYIRLATQIRHVRIQGYYRVSIAQEFYVSTKKDPCMMNDLIRDYYVVGALVAACVHLLIRLYAEGIRGYCAIKQYSKNDRQCVQDPTVVSKGENSCRVVSV